MDHEDNRLHKWDGVWQASKLDKLDENWAQNYIIEQIMRPVESYGKCVRFIDWDVGYREAWRISPKRHRGFEISLNIYKLDRHSIL